MTFRKSLFLALFLAVGGSFSIGQDTTVVQTLTFDDITKRRGTYTFPDGGEDYRKILMKYTLKCDPRTTADGFQCGEWDYLTYTRVYDHEATYDSTYRDHPSFTINGGQRDEIRYTTQTAYHQYTEEMEGIRHDNTISLESYSVGGNAHEGTLPLTTGNTGRQTVLMYTRDELMAAGLTAGPVTGLRFELSQVDEPAELLVHIKMGTTKSVATQLTELQNVDFTTVYRYPVAIQAAGWIEFQCPEPFLWDGTENLLVSVSTGPSASSSDIRFKGEITDGRALVTEEDQYALDFQADGSYVNLGRGPQVSGSAPRTIEMWAYARSFNGGGVFQAGSTGSENRDFSLRTMGSDDRWRVQLWGSGDFDVTLPGSKGSWHHYAVVYDGNTARIYYDGELIQTNTISINTGENDLWIGRWSGSYFDGMIDEIRIWDIALTSNEIKRWMTKRVDVTHVSYDRLIGYYDCNEGQGFELADQSDAMQENARFNRLPWWTPIRGKDQMTDFTAASFRPQIELQRGEYDSTPLSAQYTDSLPARPVLLTLFENPADGTIIPDDAPDHPTIATSQEVIWDADQWNYLFDANTGTAVDSFARQAETELVNQQKEWYSPTVEYEIGRFITPYGINLDLGPDGFTWYYDVTDYAALLNGEVELSAGNNQELIDLQFIFIEGTPPREIKHIKQIWGPRGSYRYSDLDNDSRLPEVVLPIHPEAMQYKVKTRISGHGHHSNTGDYPHCCEWKDNTHYLYVDGVEAADWHIFQYNECAENPVFPQGGTWPGAREGWCPGDVVKDFEFEITPMVTGPELRLDYDITDVPPTNLGMGNGNYVMSMQLVQYGPNLHEVDAELADILSPNDRQYYSRFNPSCSAPRVAIRNNGIETLTSARFEYWIRGGEKEQYLWTGELEPHEETVVELPIGDGSLWKGDHNDPRFYVEVSEPNGQTDQYPGNNRVSTSFQLPDVYDIPLGVVLQTNARPFDNTLWIRDHTGEPVFELKNMVANQVYNISLDYPEGCYTLDLLDTGNDGLRYWAFPSQGAGVLLLINRNTEAVVKSFESEFGRRIHYAFGIGSITNVEDPAVATGEFLIYPNPVSDFLNIDLLSYEEDVKVRLRDIFGQTVHSREFGRMRSYQMYTGDLPGGSYLLEITAGRKHFASPVVLQRTD